jgi:putative protein-disulfide isomerase
MKNTLIYVHDPMCSWCWGFEPTRQKFFNAVSDRFEIRRLVGGLAPDSQEPMPMAMQASLQQTWQRIEQVIPGTSFNYAFWRDCAPRRSTYPGNRAVIAARQQGDRFDEAMTARIQLAYYQEARNPSDDETLIDLADDIGLDVDAFSGSLKSAATQQLLVDEINSARSMNMDSFPSLMIERDDGLHPLMVNYTDVDAMLRQVAQITGE